MRILRGIHTDGDRLDGRGVGRIPHYHADRPHAHKRGHRSNDQPDIAGAHVKGDTVHPGKGEQISISAGILVAHHKKPLAGVLHRSHELLDMAKKTGGRNAFALELDKRSGGGRIMLGKWSALPEPRLALDEKLTTATLLEHFLIVGDSLAAMEEGSMSSSLAYRLESFRPGLEAIMAQDMSLLPTFIEQQLYRSEDRPAGTGDSNEDRRHKRRILAQSVAALLARRDHEDHLLPIESLIVAKFIGLCRKKNFDSRKEV